VAVGDKELDGLRGHAHVAQQGAIAGKQILRRRRDVDILEEIRATDGGHGHAHAAGDGGLGHGAGESAGESRSGQTLEAGLQDGIPGVGVHAVGLGIVPFGLVVAEQFRPGAVVVAGTFLLQAVRGPAEGLAHARGGARQRVDGVDQKVDRALDRADPGGGHGFAEFPADLHLVHGRRRIEFVDAGVEQGGGFHPQVALGRVQRINIDVPVVVHHVVHRVVGAGQNGFGEQGRGRKGGRGFGLRAGRVGGGDEDRQAQGQSEDETAGSAGHG